MLVLLCATCVTFVSYICSQSLRAERKIRPSCSTSVTSLHSMWINICFEVAILADRYCRLVESFIQLLRSKLYTQCALIVV